jgi:hypothetical protein
MNALEGNPVFAVAFFVLVLAALLVAVRGIR